GAAPSDAEIVGTTWRYVNKSGGPDRRFNGNSQLPICRYGELDFTSASGLNEKYECSQANAASTFASAFKAFQTEISRTPELGADRTISLSEMPSNWLSVVPVTLLCLAALAAVVIQQNMLPNLVVSPLPTTSAGSPSSFSSTGNKDIKLPSNKDNKPPSNKDNRLPSNKDNYVL